MTKKWLPVLVLVILAPVCGELLSGSAPPREFFTPFGLTVLVALYGGGAVLVREIARRWRRGWLAILALGLAYGIFEEGLVVRSFFDPTWQDLGVLAEYGRWLGVNWVWTVDLMIYHAVMSISVPILLTELLFPRVKDQPWLGRGGLIAFTLVFLLTLPVGAMFGMRASPLHLLASVLAMLALAGLARLLPPLDLSRPQPGAPGGGGWVFAVGFAATLGFIAVMWVLPSVGLPVFFTLAVTCLLLAAALLALYLLARGGWDARSQWALAFGWLVPWIALAFIQEADNLNRPDDTAGMALVGLVFLAFMVVVRLRLRRAALTESSAKGAVVSTG